MQFCHRQLHALEVSLASAGGEIISAEGHELATRRIRQGLECFRRAPRRIHADGNFIVVRLGQSGRPARPRLVCDEVPDLTSLAEVGPRTEMVKMASSGLVCAGAAVPKITHKASKARAERTTGIFRQPLPHYGAKTGCMAKESCLKPKQR